MLPLVPVYAAGAALRLLGQKPHRLASPVVSVGNLSTGGSGKTPFVIALGQLLKGQGVYIDVLSRGYGRSGTVVEQVDLQGSAEQFGDEPLLIAREAGVPVFVGAKRFDAGKLAESAPGQRNGVHLLDDGFQHRQLHRDVDIVLVNSEDLADRLLPAGNLREPLAALRRASVLAVPVDDDSAMVRLQGMGLKQPIWRFRREMRVPAITGPMVAFCGIARPEQFFAGLEGRGVLLAGQLAFPDHHRFDSRDVERLRTLVRDSGAVGLVTTGKDRVRLSALEAGLQAIAPLYTAGLRIVLEDELGALEWLRERLQGWDRFRGAETSRS
jgi:tetraacyldisaccharide 4'-kinase